MNNKEKPRIDSYVLALLILTGILIAGILFVLFGGARALYSAAQPALEPVPVPVSETISDSTAIVSPDASSGLYQDGMITSPFTGPGDFREEAFLHRVFSEWTNSRDSHMQGACTDGTTIWVGWSVPCRLMRIHVPTRKVETMDFSESEWPYGHINDMTYNPRTNKLYISAFDLDVPETYNNLAIVDADTLHLEQMVKLTKDGKAYPFYAIAYDRLHDQYIVAKSGNEYAFVNSDFEFLKTIPVVRQESDTLQGIETDGTMIYRCLWRDFDKNLFSVYDFDGNFICFVTIPISGDKTEFQDLMYDWKGNWYINTADYDQKKKLAGCSFYYVGLQSAVDYDQLEQFLSWFENSFVTSSS